MKIMFSLITRENLIIQGIKNRIIYLDKLYKALNDSNIVQLKFLAHELWPTITLQQLFRFLIIVYSLTDNVVLHFSSILEVTGTLNRPEIPILRGRDVKHLVLPGPLMGDLLKKAYQIQVQQGICDRDTLLTLLNEELK
jgi:hypothetical protein